MANKPKKPERPPVKTGWKIYFDPDTQHWLHRQAEEEGYRSGQDKVHDMVRKEKLGQKPKK